MKKYYLYFFSLFLRPNSNLNLDSISNSLILGSEDNYLNNEKK